VALLDDLVNSLHSFVSSVTIYALQAGIGKHSSQPDSSNNGQKSKCVRESLSQLELATVCDDDVLGGLVTAGGQGLNLADDIHAINDVAEDCMLAVKETGLDGADEELRAVCVRAGIRHGEYARARVLQREVLVVELPVTAIDRLTASALRSTE
jgi:hypothetical protein